MFLTRPSIQSPRPKSTQVNLLKGVRYKRVLRREVKLWACMQRAFAKLEFDADMIEALGRDYGQIGRAHV